MLKEVLAVKTFVYLINSTQQIPNKDYVFVDLFDTTSKTIQSIKGSGSKAVCYIAVTKESWRPDSSAFPAKIVGNKLGDWKGENWTDHRSKDLRDILKKRMMMAKDKGCQFIDYDNVDGHLNKTGFPLTSADQATFVRWLSVETKKLGMGLGLKNSPETAMKLSSLVDFHVVEECTKYKECSKYPVGKSFFIEYTKKSDAVCRLRPNTIFADLALKKFQFCK